MHEPYPPDVLCPTCGNDYFKDTIAFENMTSTKIWKYFKWETIAKEEGIYWKIILQYDIPTSNIKTHEVVLKTENLLSIRFRKDGYSPPKIDYKSKVVLQYSLFLDDKVQSLRNLLLEDARLKLYEFILSQKHEYIELLNIKRVTNSSLTDKLGRIRQVQMLDSTLEQHKEKSIKKELYKGYQNSINHIGYYPYSDYIFSRSIKNIDLLIKLFGIYPAIKQHIFTDETYAVAIEFIQFLKRYYTEKQIVKLFLEDIQDAEEYKSRLNNWRDTLRMLQTKNAFHSLEEHFSKVKLTAKKLHDEIVRVFHMVSYELDAKESFEYDETYLSACATYKELDFRLPKTVKELSLWAKILHNCMFGYSRSIHERRSIIYGVFREEELLYAVELNGFTIVWNVPYKLDNY